MENYGLTICQIRLSKGFSHKRNIYGDIKQIICNRF